MPQQAPPQPTDSETTTPKTESKRGAIPVRVQEIPEPLRPPPALVAYANALKSKPLWDAIPELFGTLEAKGGFGITWQSDASTGPRTAAEVLATRGGDCTSLTNWLVSGFVALGIQERSDLQIGMLVVHTKSNSPESLHAIPFLIGNIPEQYQSHSSIDQIIRSELGLSGDVQVAFFDPQLRFPQTFDPTLYDEIRIFPFQGIVASYYEEKGDFYFKKGNFENAISNYKTSLQYYPTAVTLSNLSTAYSTFPSSPSTRDNHLNSLLYAKKAYEMDQSEFFKENYLTSLVNIARYESTQGNATEAINYLTEANTLDSNSPSVRKCWADVFYNLGIVAKRDGNMQKAAEYYLKSLEYADRPETHGALSGLYAGQHPETANTYEPILFHSQKAYELEPSSMFYKQNYLVHLSNMGNLVNREGQFEEALTYTERGLLLDPQNESLTHTKAMIYFNWGVTLYNSGEAGEAKIKFQQAADLGLEQARTMLNERYQ